MHKTLLFWFARKAKASPTLPSNLQSISLRDATSDALTTQRASDLPSLPQRNGRVEVVRPKATDIRPVEPERPGAAPPTNVRHPQKYLVKTKLFSNTEAKMLLENNSIVAKNPYDDLPTSDLARTPLTLRKDQETKEILTLRHKLYVFYKPRGLICTPTDPTGRNRNTVFWYIQNYHNFHTKLFLCVC